MTSPALEILKRRFQVQIIIILESGIWANTSWGTFQLFYSVSRMKTSNVSFCRLHTWIHFTYLNFSCKYTGVSAFHSQGQCHFCVQSHSFWFQSNETKLDFWALKFWFKIFRPPLFFLILFLFFRSSPGTKCSVSSLILETNLAPKMPAAEGSPSRAPACQA